MEEDIDPLLMLASTANEGVGLFVEKNLDGRAETDYFSPWDAQDHCYDQTERCDLLVNAEHGYYQRVDQFDLPQNLEHSYAFQVPLKDVLPEVELDPLPDNLFGEGDLDMCRWDHCEFACEGAEELHHHIVQCHLNNSSRTCHWKDCSRDMKPFGVRYLLLRHLDSHIHYEAFKCDECGRGFVTAERLRLHKRARHHPEVNYICDQCHEMFKTTSDRANHISRVHMKQRFVCPHCHKLYAGRSSLRTHLKKCPSAVRLALQLTSSQISSP